PRAMAAEFRVAQVLHADAYILDGGNQVQAVHPTHERSDLVGDDRLGLVRFARPFAPRLRHDRPKVVDVVQIDVFHRVEPIVEITRYAHVDQEYRAIAAIPQHDLEIRGIQYRTRGRERANHDVGELEKGAIALQRNGGPAQRSRQGRGVVKAS